MCGNSEERLLSRRPNRFQCSCPISVGKGRFVPPARSAVWAGRVHAAQFGRSEVKRGDDAFRHRKDRPHQFSPEAESVARYPLTRTDADPNLVMTESGDRALNVWLRWPAPLNTIMPLLSSADDIHAQAQLSNIARLSSSDYAGSLRGAEVGAQRYLFSGHTTLEHSWFRPALAEKGVRHVIFRPRTAD